VAIIFIIFSVFLVLFSWTQIPADIALFLGFNIPIKLESSISGLIYILIIIGLFLSYLRIIQAIKTGKLASRSVQILIFTSSLIFLFGFPFFSEDILNYAFTAKIITTYRRNPFQATPQQFSNDSWFNLINWQNLATPYGPVWVLLTTIPSYLGKSNLLLTVFLIKILVAVFHFGVLFLIRGLAKEVNPGHQSFYLSLYALNSLTLIETLLNGHNDVVMVFFFLLSLWWLSSSQRWSFLFWILSALSKRAVLAIFPLYLLAFVVKRLKIPFTFSSAIRGASVFLLPIILLSPLRRELNLLQDIHPWYLVWILPLVVLMDNTRYLQITIVSSFLLLLVYVPDLLGAPLLGIWTTTVFREMGIGATAILTFVGAKHLRKYYTQSKDAK
jgi:hypothetical protein